MATCKRGEMVEVDGEVMAPGEYLRRQRQGETRPVGYEKDVLDLNPCPEINDPRPDDDDGLGM